MRHVVLNANRKLPAGTDWSARMQGGESAQLAGCVCNIGGMRGGFPPYGFRRTVIAVVPCSVVPGVPVQDG
jgi:hypothetical protein